LHAWVAEAERGRGPAVVVLGGQDDPLECGGVGRAGAGLRLRVEQALVDLVPDPDERSPVGLAEQTADGEVVAVVDRRLGAQRAALLEVLLDLGGAVVDLDPALDAAVDRPRLKRPGVWREIRRPKTTATWSGRPSVSWSRSVCSNQSRPACGRSKTRVSESSSWPKASR
jgi:hypothetical protein